MSARSRDLNGAPSLLLAVNLGQVVLSPIVTKLQHGLSWRLSFNALRIDEVRNHARQVGAWNHLEAFNERRLSRITSRHEDSFPTMAPQPTRGDQHSVDMAYGAVKGELAKKCGP
jgi:hypothetical protein